MGFLEMLEKMRRAEKTADHYGHEYHQMKGEFMSRFRKPGKGLTQVTVKEPSPNTTTTGPVSSSSESKQ